MEKTNLSTLLKVTFVKSLVSGLDASTSQYVGRGEIMATHLTKSFTLEELTYSDTAKKFGINNKPTQQVINNLKILCENVLQPLRDYLGKPINVTSGYRSPEVNKRVGGAVDSQGRPKSQHCFGMAADIQVKGKTPRQVCDTIDKLVKEGKIKTYDQLIEEFGATGWCHVSFNISQNRKMRFKIGC